MLRNLQRQRLIKMLMPDNPPFKVLLLDTNTQSILSPILKISDLRDAGVTAHFLISNSRSQIKDIPAFYFISSADGIVKDLSIDLYASYYLNCSSSFKRSDLEEMAKAASEKQIAFKVQSVYDQFLQFIAVQDDLFTLNISNSFIQRNDPISLRLSAVGLFSLFTTLNEIPFIISKTSLNQSSDSTLKECEIGHMLETKMRNTKIIKPALKKPLLLILSRDFDLVTPLRHTMGYLELIHDIFNIRLNRASGITIDTDSEFFKNNWFLDFPTVAEIVDKELHNYKKELAVRSLSEKSDKAEIQAALENAPHLQKKNEIVNSNLNICVKVLDEIKKRKLDEFFRMEENLVEDDLIELASNGNENDILRFCITLIGTKHAELIKPILEKRGLPEKILEYFYEAENDKGGSGLAGFGSKMKNILFKKNIPVYSYLENAFSQIKNQKFYDKIYDPTNSGIFLTEISRIIVYINGGATYTELKALKEFEKAYKIPVILGGSEIINADSFLDQIRSDL